MSFYNNFFNFILFIICASQHYLPLNEQNDSICFISQWFCSLEVLHFSDLLSINGSPTCITSIFGIQIPFVQPQTGSSPAWDISTKRYFYLISTSQLILPLAHYSSTHPVLNLSYLETRFNCYMHSFAGILRSCPSLCRVLEQFSKPVCL